MIAVFFISLIAFFTIGVPIATSLGLASMIGVVMHESLPLQVIPQRLFTALNSFPLMAVPFFVLAGGLMQQGGISKRLVNFASSLVGHLTGGLAMVAILTSMFFAAISGSGPATTLAIGSILIPAMVARGYKVDYAAANQAVSGALGVIIPPSIAFILYGVVAQVSVGDLFLAGILPGILITFSLLIGAYFISKKNNYVGDEKSSLKDVLFSFKEAILALMMPIIVLGGIYSGVFTPTEAGVIAVFYALIVGFIYREIKLKDIPSILLEGAITTSIIMIIIATAGAFGFYISIVGIPSMISDFVLNITTSQIVFLLIINVLLLLAGMVLEGAAATLIFVPLLLPMALEFGIDPIHFGMIMTVNLAIGLVTPPVGVNLFAASQIAKTKITSITKAVFPLIIILIIDLLLITFIPIISTFIPSLMK
jgi:C4-dicarboxylate transporter, DctM subunit